MKRLLSVLLVLGLLLSIFAVGASALEEAAALDEAGPPDWLENEELTTWQWFQKGFHRFVVHFLFGWLWMPWFNMLWYGGMDYVMF